MEKKKYIKEYQLIFSNVRRFSLQRTDKANYWIFYFFLIYLQQLSSPGKKSRIIYLMKKMFSYISEQQENKCWF